MDTGYFQFLSEPAKVWHLCLLGFFLLSTLREMQKQMSAVGKCVLRIVEQIEKMPHNAKNGGGLQPDLW